MSNKLNAGIPFGTPIKFFGRDGVYVEFVPENPNQHKLLINYGDHPYFTTQPIHAFSVVREVAQTIADERDELRAICEALIVAHDWAIANPDSPISATINFGHVAHDARQVLAKYAEQ